jgi:hypothetical protein
MSGVTTFGAYFFRKSGKGSRAMPIESILFLCLVIGALVEFAVVLAYAEWAWKQTLPGATPKLVHSKEPKPSHRPEDGVLRDKAA